MKKGGKSRWTSYIWVKTPGNIIVPVSDSAVRKGYWLKRQHFFIVNLHKEPKWGNLTVLKRRTVLLALTLAMAFAYKSSRSGNRNIRQQHTFKHERQIHSVKGLYSSSKMNKVRTTYIIYNLSPNSLLTYLFI